MPRSPLIRLALATALLLPTWAGAQLALPGAVPGQGALPGIVPDLLGGVTGALGVDDLQRLSPAQVADRLLTARTERLAAFVRSNRDAVAIDDRGQPAVRSSILVTGIDAAGIAVLKQAGYAPEAERIEGLDLAVVRLAAPGNDSLARAIRRVRTLVPGAEVSGDPLYLVSGDAGPTRPAGAGLAISSTVGAGAIGLIDGGVAANPALTGPVEQRGFARGAPSPSAHGTAVASLLSGTGPIRGAAPGAPLLVADVYGRDPAGGGALAIARALGWMAARGVMVVTMSLVGPENPLLGGAIRAARDRGMRVVAAVGNDGPAAPPAYPASWPGVIAVTGVDRHDRALIEAGRTLHLDFAAPGADMVAAGPDGRMTPVRGTSFAAPLVAGRLYRVRSVEALAGEAKDLGRKGPDTVYGRGLVCGSCRNIK